MVTRRQALVFGSAGWIPLNGCGGSESGSSAAGWRVGQVYFLAGDTATVDLSLTLPSEVVKGGTFGVSASGTPLPSGMTLTQSGILAVGSATAVSVDGVVFTYVEPMG